MPELLLVASKLSKRFGGLQALSDVSFSICKGDIYGLIGPNGAGKTTLFNVLTSLYVPESGTCNFMGHQLTKLKPHEIARCGLARTFQNIRLFGSLSAIENVMIGRHIRTSAGVFGAVTRNKRTRDEEAAIEQRALELLDYVGIAHRANDVARSLPYG
ncbi:MAG: ATP-binding cassette domain-containing protein, partial [Candidimonas sp.]